MKLKIKTMAQFFTFFLAIFLVFSPSGTQASGPCDSSRKYEKKADGVYYYQNLVYSPTPYSFKIKVKNIDKETFTPILEYGIIKGGNYYEYFSNCPGTSYAIDKDSVFYKGQKIIGLSPENFSHKTIDIDKHELETLPLKDKINIFYNENNYLISLAIKLFMIVIFVIIFSLWILRRIYKFFTSNKKNKK